jgi:Uma2 family endonuclease
MKTRVEPELTIEDLEAMPDDGNRYEIIEGELFVSRSPGLTHQIVSDNIVFLIRDYLRTNTIGVVVSTPGLVLSDLSGVIPDIVFFSNERRDRVVSDERLIGSPELVIEILSGGAENSKRDRIVKRQLYAKHCVSEYWIVDYRIRTVDIYRLIEESLELVVTLNEQDKLSSPVLPQFECRVQDVFRQF